MATNKILSIIIPTRNREETAIITINTLYKFLSKEDCEIIITDNSDTNTLYDKIKSIIDNDFIKYTYSNEILSTGMNFDRAIPLITGEFCCFIGDDDGINPHIINIIKQLKKKYKFDSLIDNKSTVRFCWKGSINNGTLDIDPYTNKIEIYDTQKEVIKLLKDGGAEYQKYSLPKLYHGFVKSDIVLSIYKTYGHIFSLGISPDLYAVILLTSKIKKVLVYNHPLTISGSSKKSENTHRSTTSSTISIENAPHFRGFHNYKWSSYVPFIYSPYTVWAESCVHALNMIGEDDKLRFMNKKILGIQIIQRDPKYQKEIINFLDIKYNKHFILKYYRYQFFINDIIYRIKVKLERILHGTPKQHIENLDTIEDAILIIQKEDE